MTLTVPLGVRVFNTALFGPAVFDTWITRYVADISFRSVVPGGFASATITLHRPPPVTMYSSATATGTGTSITPDYLVATDADAGDINVGDRVHIYDSSGAIRFGGAPFKVTSKNSAFGFTNIFFTPNASASTVSGDVMRCTNAVGYLPSAPGVFAHLAELFTKVQIVDLRSAEIVWEGRIEDPARNTSDDTWELGCLGSMVAASDIQRPYFLIDNSLESWIPNSDYIQDSFNLTSEEALRTLGAKAANATWSAGSELTVYRHQRCEETGQYLGRFDITYVGAGPSTMHATTYVADGGFSSVQLNVDVTALNAAAVRKANAVGAASSFTSTTAQQIGLECGGDTSTVITDSNTASEQWVRPHVQAQRLDITGDELDTSASYPNDYVTVEEAVSDVVGRFLVSGWPIGLAQNIPFAGQVRSTDAFIDDTSTAEITNLTFFDGATAADVLNEIMLAEPDGYWAIWESRYGASSRGSSADKGYRFEWARWPDGWGYQATSVDGLQEQPSGEGVYDLVFYKWATDSTGSLDKGHKYMATATDNQPYGALGRAAITRAITIQREELTDSSTATTAAADHLAAMSKPTNAGSLTIRRPIPFYDPGEAYSGASRMADPWEIRPGKLIRVTDMPAASKWNAFQHGTSAPPSELDGTIFRIVATQYSSADNTVVLELDQVVTWSTPTQIRKASEGKPGALRVKG